MCVCVRACGCVWVCACVCVCVCVRACGHLCPSKLMNVYTVISMVCSCIHTYIYGYYMTSFPFQIGIHGIQIEFVNHNGDTKTATYLPEVALDHGTQCGVGVWFCTRNGFCVFSVHVLSPLLSPLLPCPFTPLHPPFPVLSSHSFLPPCPSFPFNP